MFLLAGLSLLCGTGRFPSSSVTRMTRYREYGCTGQVLTANDVAGVKKHIINSLGLRSDEAGRAV